MWQIPRRLPLPVGWRDRGVQHCRRELQGRTGLQDPNDGTLGRFRRSRRVEVWASGFHQREVFVGDVLQFILVDFAFEDFFANLGNREDVSPGSKERTSTIKVGLIHTEDVASVLICSCAHHSCVDCSWVWREPYRRRRVKD